MRSVRRSLSVDAEKTLINAFITSRINYCNSVFTVTGRSDSSSSATISIEYKSATNLKEAQVRPDYSNRDVLHWLPILQRIEDKLCDLVYKAKHHSAPVYRNCVFLYQYTKVVLIFAQQHMEI